MSKFIPNQQGYNPPKFDKDTVMAASAAIESLVKWEYCDCGCPQQRKASNAEAVDFLRIASFIRVELLS
jgi:hypothetical protein